LVTPDGGTLILDPLREKDGIEDYIRAVAAKNEKIKIAQIITT
jgi:hypothetical protein